MGFLVGCFVKFTTWWYGEERLALWIIGWSEKLGAQREADEVRLAFFQSHGRWPGTANVKPPEGSANAGGKEEV